MGTTAAFKLQDAGFTRPQEEALSEFMDTQAASKCDLQEVKAELKGDIASLKAELKDDIAAVKAEIADTRADLRVLEQRMTVKLGGMIIVAVGILLAGIRYLSAGH